MAPGSSTSSKSSLDRALVLAFFLSGAAALGYELLWTRLLSVALGSESLGVLGVLGGFFGGMALGSAVLHRRARQSPNPAGLFAGLELAAAAYALVSPYVLYGLADLVPKMLGPIAGDNDTPLALALSLLVAGAALLPGTFCMGATLAALVEARRRVIDDTDGRGVGRLYAANTLGATVGILFTVYLLLPAVGMALGAAVLAAVGVVAAVVAQRWGRRHEALLRERIEVSPRVVEVDATGDPDPDVAREPWLLLVVLTVTGLLGVGLEVVGVQVLTQLLENTVYTFADILAVYLVATAIGAAIYGRFAARAVAGRPAIVAAAMMVALSISTIGCSLALAGAPELLRTIAPDDASVTVHLIGEMVLAAVIFGPPAALMGALFSHIIGLVAPSGVGRAYALNTLGSAAAPLLFALWVIPEVGYRDALFVVVYGYLILFGMFTWFRRFTTKWQLAAVVGVVALTAVAPASLVLIEPDEGWKPLEIKETAMGLVVVSEQPAEGNRKPLRRLQVGRHFRMGGALAFGERRMGHIPLVLANSRASGKLVEQALFLGIGTGATLGAVAELPLRHVDAVELVPGVLETLEYFDEINHKVRNADHVSFHAADARRFVAASERSYDLVVADLFHPGLDGAGALYAREHFEAIAEHLAPGGSFAQWIPLYQFDRDTLGMVMRTFAEVFGDVHVFLGIYNVQTPAIVLLGRAPDAAPIDLDELRKRLEGPVYAAVLMQDPRDLFGAYLLDREAMLAFAGEGPLNTDLHPRVLLQAPRVAYGTRENLGWDNLSALLDARREIPPALLVADDPQVLAGFLEESERFAVALEIYLRAEHLRGTGDPAAKPSMAAIDEYLRAYDVAPEFGPARGMLYGLALRDADVAERVYPAMLARTPDERRVYDSYLAYLRKIGDEARFDAIREQARARFDSPSADAPLP